MGRAGFLLKKILAFKLVEHDVATETPVRGPDGFCREVSQTTGGSLHVTAIVLNELQAATHMFFCRLAPVKLVSFLAE